jgi:hypothetical protein
MSFCNCSSCLEYSVAVLSLMVKDVICPCMEYVHFSPECLHDNQAVAKSISQRISGCSIRIFPVGKNILSSSPLNMFNMLIAYHTLSLNSNKQKRIFNRMK